MIVSVCGDKGGPGKSNTTIELAVIHKLRGNETILVDTDIRATAPKSTFFWQCKRKEEGIIPFIPCVILSGKGISGNILQLSKTADVFVDIGADKNIEMSEALFVSDIGLFPIETTAFDLWPLEEFSRVIDKIKVLNPKLKAKLYFNKVSPHKYDTDKPDAINFLKEHHILNTFDLAKTDVKLRKSFKNAKALGMSVLELEPKDEKAVNEITALYEEVLYGR